MAINEFENFKRELYEDLDKRVQDKILEPTNAELLKRHIDLCRTKAEAISIAELGTTYKRTGFHFDKKLEKLSDKVKYFKRNGALSFVCDPDKPTHKLIIGDNYDALQNLLVSYKEGIDVIYFDPPYGKDSMGEFAKTNYQNSISRDNLLSMLYSRLFLAKRLLSPKGVIYCSVDDKNQAYIKCLFDEIFGENNFAGMLIWQSATDNNARQISTEHEYILCYCRNLSLQGKWTIRSAKAKLIADKYSEIKSRLSDINEIQKELRDWIKKNKDSLSGVVHYNNVDEKGVYSSSSNSSNTKPGGYEFDIIHPVTGKPCVKPDFGWRWTETTFNEYADAGEVVWGKDETTQPHIKKRIETVEEQLKSVYYEDGRAATSLLFSIIPEKKIFDNPKTVNYVSRLLNFCSGPNAVILDFFAGSGTTAHAVAELNRADGGNRTCILCQLNEVTDTTPNGIAYDVTSKRLKRIMTGTCYDGSSDFKWVKSNEPYSENLDVYDIAEISESDPGIFEALDETLYGEKFDTLKKKVEWVCTKFGDTRNVLKDAEGSN